MVIGCFDGDVGYTRSDTLSSAEWTDVTSLNSDNGLYSTGFTKVSKLLGFDLIPNLKIFIRRNFYFKRIVDTLD